MESMADSDCCLVAQVVGFLVGSIPQVRKVLIGNSAPLRVVEDSASLLG